MRNLGEWTTHSGWNPDRGQWVPRWIKKENLRKRLAYGTRREDLRLLRAGLRIAREKVAHDAACNDSVCRLIPAAKRTRRRLLERFLMKKEDQS